MNTLKYGLPTLIELETLEENVTLCKALGLDFVEINMSLPQFQIDRLDADLLINLKDKYGVFFTFHLAEDIDIGHFNKRVRKAYFEEVIATIELMKSTGSEVLNMHLHKGIHFTMPNGKIFLYEKFNKEYLQNVCEFFELVKVQTRGTKIKVLIENTGIYNHGYIADVVKCLLQNKCFGLTWDVGHDFSSHHADREILENYISRIEHMHLHDGIDKANHMTLYDGEIDIDRHIEFSRERALTVVIETKTIASLKESVKRLIESGGIYV